MLMADTEGGLLNGIVEIEETLVVRVKTERQNQTLMKC